MHRKRYLVKCLACDQTFWLDDRAAPVPQHGPWNRRLEPRPSPGHGCPGTLRSGHWIGEEPSVKRKT